MDLPTAFYIRDAELNDFDTPEPEGSVAGQIATESGEYFGMVLEKDSPLTSCVDQAITTLTENGELEAITQEWLSDFTGAPVITVE